MVVMAAKVRYKKKEMEREWTILKYIQHTHTHLYKRNNRFKIQIKIKRGKYTKKKITNKIMCRKKEAEVILCIFFSFLIFYHIRVDES